MAGMNLSFAAGVRAADTIQAKPQKPETGSSDKSSFESAIKNEADKAGQQAGKTENGSNNKEEINDGGHVGKKPGGKGQDGRKNALDTNGENQTAAVILLENFVIPMDTENMLNSLKHAESNAETLAEHITDAVANETVELTADTKGIDISALKKAQPEVVDIKQKLIEQASAAPRENAKANTAETAKTEEPVVISGKNVNTAENDKAAGSETTVVKNKDSAEAEGVKTENKNSGATLEDVVLVKDRIIDGKAVTVKVAEPVNVNSQDFADKLGEEILRTKQNEFEIQLAPENLGKIQIKLVFEKGETRVSILCANPKALEALTDHANGIAAALESKTGATATVNITQEKETFYNENYQDGHNSRENGGDENRRQKQKKDDAVDFLQQLRLGLV